MKQATLIDHEKMIYNIVSVLRDSDETQHAEGLLCILTHRKRRTISR